MPSEGLAKTQPRVIRLALLHAQHHPAAMLPVALSFDRKLRVKIVNLETHEEHVKMVRVPCKKPAQPGKPNAAALARLAPLERTFKAVVAAQWLCLDAEALADSFAPLLKMIGDAQGIRAHGRPVE